MAVRDHVFAQVSFFKLFFTSNKTLRLTTFLNSDHILGQGSKGRKAFILPMEEMR